MAFSQHTEKLLAEKSYVLERVLGQDLEGRDIYAYLLVKKNRVSAFQQALAARNVTLSEFGILLAHGTGNIPPEGLEEQLIKRLSEEA